MKSITRVYNDSSFCVPLCFCILATFFLQGCVITLTTAQKNAKQEDIVEAINAAREAEGLEPLAVDETLSRTALAKAEEAANRGEVQQDSNRLPALVAAGSFARFALSHEVGAMVVVISSISASKSAWTPPPAPSADLVPAPGSESP